MALEIKAVDYAQRVVNGELVNCFGKKTIASKYVIKQCQEFLRIARGDDDQWYVSQNKVKQIENILKLLIMPKGLKAGESLYECSKDYQWLVYTAIFCVVSSKDEHCRKYERLLLEICRKNFKTYTIATIFIIAFLTEPPFSRFYSVAPDGALSREVRDAIDETIKSSPAIYRHGKHYRFKILRDYIKFLPTESRYEPLNYTNSRFDGRLPNLYLADEVGALPNNYAIEAMSSGQLNIKNKLGCLISTKYPTIDNPLEDEVSYAKKVLDGDIDDPTLFALLYEPDDCDWESNDLVLEQGNPVALQDQVIWDDLVKKRTRAIDVPSARENFITKHCNIIYQGPETESYIPIEYVQAASAPSVDFGGLDVYVGVDLAMTNDNCAVAIAAEYDGEIIADAIAFIPEDRVTEKTVVEKLDYRREIDAGNCIACGDMTVDYSVIERFVENIETEYGCHVVSIGYDRWNALSSAQKWENDGYQTVEIRQHSSVLHPPTKLIAEKVMSGEFHFRENRLLEINFQNARCTYDTNLNRYVTKKKSTGKVDMVVALINAVYLLQQDVIFGDDWVCVTG